MKAYIKPVESTTLEASPASSEQTASTSGSEMISPSKVPADRSELLNKVALVKQQR